MSHAAGRTDATELLPADAFLDGYPTEIRRVADRLRAVVRRAVPTAVERVRPGWRLIGFDVPTGRRSAYFAYVAPERAHVHLGFEHGVWLADPERLLEGAHLRLRKVRFVTFVPGQAIPTDSLVALTRDAARIAALSRAARVALALDREMELDAGGGWKPDA
ncbi:MAG TPA: DUF1801 domain-containing protein [Candidatus Limnocylindrales bacterium]|jgi:hypothetical protein